MYYRGAMITGVVGVPWGLLRLLIFLGLLTISNVADPIPTNKDGQSICKLYQRINVTKNVSYMETFYHWDYGYRTEKTRINYKSQQFTNWKLIEMCCPGYEPYLLADDAENCVPVCSSNCFNGTCHRPNKCICDPGYGESINESTGFSECKPNCTSGCDGGSCIAPETCSCDSGYTPAENESRCEPSCVNVGGSGLQNCGENAICIAPNTCKCHIGYMAQERTWLGFPTPISTMSTFHFKNVTCEPLCKPECDENAHCIAPNKCECTADYSPDSSSNDTIRCRPICKQHCHNGDCSSPNECTCHEGYRPHDLLGEIFCEPICDDDCINGKCTEPNHCECAFGYEKLVIGPTQKQIVSKNVCVPICPGNCSNGRCIAPGQCHCNQGYIFKALDKQIDTGMMNTGKNISKYLIPQKTCQPNCEPECLNGYFCEAPNQCQIQYNDEMMLDKFPKFRTRVINSTDDCGIAHVSTENNKTACLYKSKDTNCFESNPCAIIIVDHQETINNFTSLQSIISLINETMKSSHDVTNSENNQIFKWFMPRCTKECRILIPFERLSEVLHEDEIDDCYELKLHNKTTGVFLRPTASPNVIRRKGIRRVGGVWIPYPAICFLKDHFPSYLTTSMKTEDVIESNVRGVVIGIMGTTLILVLVVALGVLLYRGRKKLRNLHFRGVSASDETVMVGSMTRLSTGEN